LTGVIKLPNMRACQCGGLCTVKVVGDVIKICCIACLTGIDIEATDDMLRLVDSILSGAKEMESLEAQLNEAKNKLQDLVR
jgi:hypothetical protein